jgi:hypothetical protein
MVGEPDAVIGTYRPALSPQALFWGAIGLGSAVLVVVEGIERKWAWVGVSVLLLVSSAVSLWRLRTVGHTIVSPSGLRVRRGFGWRDLSWDEVESIDRQRDIFGYDTGVFMKTVDGDAVLLSVPAKLCDALVAYADAHRDRRPPWPESTQEPPPL